MKLKIYMLQHGLTNLQMAALLDISPSYFSTIVTGFNTPSKRLSKAIYQLTDGAVYIEPSLKTKRAKKEASMVA